MKQLAAALAATVLVGACLANDTTARVSAGGIEFLKSENIRILQETLQISPKLITVRYRFLNESDADIRATVAFPMPPYGWNPGHSAVDENERPMRSFVVKVDGKPVATRMLRRARVGSLDITSRLRELGLSDHQIFETFGDAREDGDGLTPRQRRGVQSLAGSERAQWQVAETMLWEQLFPARRELLVEHEYVPFVGFAYSAPYQRGFGMVGRSNLVPSTARGLAKSSAEACVQDGAQQVVDKRVRDLAASGPEMVYLRLRDIEYVLGTGRNWRGPIGDFRLVIRKESPDQIVSLCFPGKPTRTSATTLEFNHTNFVPQDKIVVYFYDIQSN